MRVLVSSTPAYGHLQPMLPLARALVAAGHEVAVAIAPAMCDRAAAAGLTALAAGADFDTWWPLLQARHPERPWERLTPDGILLWFTPHLFVEVGAHAMVGALRAHVDRWRPDLLVHESYEFAAPAVAAAAGIPCVHHTLSPLAGADVYRACGEAAAPMWRELGLSSPPLAGLAGLTLDICPPSLRNPHGPALDARPLRPVASGSGDGAAPDWLDHLAARPLVHLTLGTAVTNANQELLAAAVAGLRDLPLALVVTVGPDMTPPTSGSSPGTSAWSDTSPTTCCCRAAPRSSSTAAPAPCSARSAAGCPLLTIPQGADQYVNAGLCAARGVGRTLLSDDVTPEAVAAEMDLLLGDPGYRAAAAEVAAEIAAMPSPEEAVTLLELLVSGGRQGEFPPQGGASAPPSLSLGSGGGLGGAEQPGEPVLELTLAAGEGGVAGTRAEGSIDGHQTGVDGGDDRQAGGLLQPCLRCRPGPAGRSPFPGLFPR